MTKWITARSLRMLAALFGLSLMLSACDVSQLLTLLDGSTPAKADAATAEADDTSPSKAGADKAAPANKKSKAKKPAADEPEAKKPKAKKPAADEPETKKPKAKKPAPENTTANTGSLSKVEAEIFELLNATRAGKGLKPLALDTGIATGARDYSCQMAKTGKFKHADLRSAGVSGENIAAGYRSAERVHDGWMKSPGHNRNRMSDRWKSYGVGVCTASSGTPYYTERFR